MTEIPTLYLYILGCAALLSVLFFIYLLIKQTKSSQNDMRKKLNLNSGKDVKNNLYFLYRIYMATPLVRRYYVKLKNNYRATIPADEVTLNAITTKRVTFCLGICLAILVFLTIVGKGDIPYMLVGLLACYIMFTNLINNSEQNMQIKILDQEDMLISDVYANYSESHKVDEALSDTLDNLPYEIGLHANVIHDIITSADIELEIEKYTDVAPNRFLLLFATICATIQENGDKMLKSGRLMFLQNLEYLKTELGNERLRLRKRTLAFSGKTFAVLIPLFCLKPIEIWIAANMPEVSDFFESSGGVISMAIIMVLTYICYEFINILKDDHNIEARSDRLYRKIAEIPIINKYITAWINHNYTKSKRLSDKLKSVGGSMSIQSFIIKRFVMALVLFVIVNSVAFIAIYKNHKTLVTDFKNAYTSTLVPNEEYREQMRQMSSLYASEIKGEPSYEEFLALLDEENMDEVYKKMVFSEIEARSKEYHEHYYKVYILLLALFVGVIGFNIPLLQLLYQEKIMGMAREDEVAQFNTIILILMHSDGMTIDKVLEWMERFACSFKQSITDCILNLEKDEQQALEDMRENESGFLPFRRLCDSLLNVDNGGLEDAFGNLEADRNYYQQKRKDDNEAVLIKCTSQANILQFIPVWAVIILYLILPIAMYALQMYNEMSFSF